MEGYTDTFLIDCNRRQSEEFKSGNLSSFNSDYTCKTGVGLTLNPGDRVSVNSGYLSRRGAAGETIELTGRETGKKISLNGVSRVDFQQQITPQNYFGLNIPAENYGQIAEVYGCQQYTETTTDYPIRDNQAHFNISYYKTTNGEGYFHLPRRFDALKTQFFDDHSGGPYIHQDWVGLWHPSYNDNDECNYARDWAGTAGAVRPPMDCFRMGMSYGGAYPTNWDPTATQDPTTEGLFLAYNRPIRRCAADMYFYQEGQTENIHGTNAGGGTGAGGAGNSASGARSDLLSFVWKKKNDNSRHTLFQKEISYFAVREPRKWFMPDVFLTDDGTTREDDIALVNNTLSRHDYQSVDDTTLYMEKRDPAQSEYILYQETKHISVEPGNYAPGDLASLLTDQLNETQEPKYIVASVASRGYPTSVDDTGLQPVSANDEDPSIISNYIAKQVIVSSTTESTCHRPFHSATSVSVESKAWDDFRQGNSLNIQDVSYHKGDEMNICNYLSSYQSVGFKRPEFINAGRKIMKELGYRHLGFDDGYIDVGSGGIQQGTFDKSHEFNWLNDKPAITDTDTPGIRHGGTPYPDEQIYRERDLVGKISGWSWKQIHNPFIVKEIVYDLGETEVVLSYHWTKNNLDGLKEFFRIQGKYPEMFEGVLLEDTPTENESTYNKGITNQNARFLHINHRDGVNTGTNVYKNTLGTDFYNHTDIRPTIDPEGKGVGQWATDAFFFDFDPTRENIASGGADANSKYYGLFLKRQATNPYTGNTEDFIAIDTSNLGGIMDMYYDVDGGGSPSHISAGSARTIGYDLHFCAYGNAAICLYAGYLSAQLKTLDITEGVLEEVDGEGGLPKSQTNSGKTACTGYPLSAPAQEVSGQFYVPQEGGYANGLVVLGQKPIHQYLKFRYAGAENPAIVFDATESKFSFQQLHTPERVGNLNNAGQTPDNPISEDTNQAVYFINKRLLLREYCPDMFPYSRLTKSQVPTTQQQLTTYSSHFNNNITPFSIMDADSGIFIEDFGYENLTDEDWNLSLWAMLGFQRSQFYSTNQILSRQTRINNTITTDNIGKPTTNANVEPADLSQLITNVFGAELRTGQIPAIMGAFEITAVDTVIEANKYAFNLPLQFLPGATINQKSAQINALSLPVKTRQPYLLVKSDIITDTKYLGSFDSGVSLPIISIVNKTGTSDFFTGAESQEFTITNTKTISSIRTQILTPDGKLAELDGDTSVIYRIIKINNSSLNVAEQMLQQAQKSQKNKKK